MAGNKESALKAGLTRYENAGIMAEFLKITNVDEFNKKTDEEKLKSLKEYAKENKLKLKKGSKIIEPNKLFDSIKELDRLIKKDIILTVEDSDRAIKDLNQIIHLITTKKNDLINRKKEEIENKIKELQEELNKIQ